MKAEGTVNIMNVECKRSLLDEKWGKKYPMVIKSWQQNWDNLTTYFKGTVNIIGGNKRVLS
jgi:putative transposase